MPHGEIDQAHRMKMETLELAIRNELEPVELEVRHHFAHGTYTRELFIPKGTVLTGHIHRHSVVNIISKGRILAVSDEGEREIGAPFAFVTGPFVKKAGFALEDTVWLNVHPWDGVSTVDEIEKLVIVPSYEALEREVKVINGESAWLG